MYIFLNKCSTVDINEQNIKNRQHLVNMKALAVLFMTESRITFLYLDPDKAHTLYCIVVQEKLYSEYFNFTQTYQNEYIEDLKYGDNQGHFIIL